jgi:hypothetical protein
LGVRAQEDPRFPEIFKKLRLPARGCLKKNRRTASAPAVQIVYGRNVSLSITEIPSSARFRKIWQRLWQLPLILWSSLYVALATMRRLTSRYDDRMTKVNAVTAMSW